MKKIVKCRNKSKRKPKILKFLLLIIFQIFKMCLKKFFFPTLIQSSIILSCASIHCILLACPGDFVLKERAEKIPSRSLSLQEDSIPSSLLSRMKRTGSEHLHWSFLLVLNASLLFLEKCLNLGWTWYSTDSSKGQYHLNIPPVKTSLQILS